MNKFLLLAIVSFLCCQIANSATLTTKQRMAIAFDECVKEKLSPEVQEAYNSCRMQEVSKVKKAFSGKKRCVGLVPREEMKALMECVTQKSAQ